MSLAPTDAAPIVGRPLYAAGRRVVAAALHVAGRPRLEAPAGVPRTGGLLMVANHVSMLDPPLLATLVPRRLVFLTKAELFRPAWWGWLLECAGMIPVRRGAPDRQALDRTLAALTAGAMVVVFAEGTRSRDGVLARAQAGVGLLAARSGVPVLPAAVLGTERLRRPGDCLARPELVVRCGPPLPGEHAARGGSAYYQARADAIMREVARLLPPERRGPYGEAGDGPAVAAAAMATRE